MDTILLLLALLNGGVLDPNGDTQTDKGLGVDPNG